MLVGLLGVMVVAWVGVGSRLHLACICVVKVLTRNCRLGIGAAMAGMGIGPLFWFVVDEVVSKCVGLLDECRRGCPLEMHQCCLQCV